METYRRDENGGTEFLEQDLREGLKDRVADEEDRQCVVVLVVGHVQVFLEPVNFGIPDVGPIQKGQEIEQA